MPKLTEDEMFIWMTQQDAGQLIRVFAKWLEAGWPRRIHIARALRDMGYSMNNYCFDVEQITEIEAPNRGGGWSITLRNDEEFGK